MFHHAHGLTDGLKALADRVRAAGHVVHTPDTYGGRVFVSLDDGIQHADHIGHDAIIDVAHRACRQHRDAQVVMGFSLGTVQAQMLAQHVQRIHACILFGGMLPPEVLGGRWRAHLPLQAHVADPDDWCPEDEREALLREAPHAEMHTYPGLRHMFADRSLADYDADAADLFEERLLDFLERIDTHRAGPDRQAI